MSCCFTGQKGTKLQGPSQGTWRSGCLVSFGLSKSKETASGKDSKRQSHDNDMDCGLWESLRVKGWNQAYEREQLNDEQNIPIPARPMGM